MKAATFKDGELWFRNFWKSRSDMERQAEAFETGRYANPQLAAECRQAIAAYDSFCITEQAA